MTGVSSTNTRVELVVAFFRLQEDRTNSYTFCTWARSAVAACSLTSLVLPKSKDVPTYIILDSGADAESVKIVQNNFEYLLY